MAGTFDFCPGLMVPKTKPPQATKGISMNGWFFAAKPNVPYQKTFVVKLQGLVWYLQSSGLYDILTNPTLNARRLELFYETNGCHDFFDYPHPHLGTIQCRFAKPVEIPEAIPNSGGLIDAFEIELVQHNPGFA